MNLYNFEWLIKPADVAMKCTESRRSLKSRVNALKEEGFGWDRNFPGEASHRTQARQSKILKVTAAQIRCILGRIRTFLVWRCALPRRAARAMHAKSGPYL